MQRWAGVGDKGVITDLGMERNFISCPEPRTWHMGIRPKSWFLAWTYNITLLLRHPKVHVVAIPFLTATILPLVHTPVLQLRKKGILLSCFSSFSFLSSPEEHTSLPKNGCSCCGQAPGPNPALPPFPRIQSFFKSSVAPTAAKSRTWWERREATLRHRESNCGLLRSAQRVVPRGLDLDHSLWLSHRKTSPHYSLPVCVLPISDELETCTPQSTF